MMKQELTCNVRSAQMYDRHHLETAQLLLVDTESQSILLGKHTDKGFFPGRITGLIGEAPTLP